MGLGTIAYMSPEEREERAAWRALEASSVAAERARVVGYLRREAEALTECGLDGSAVAHLAARIEQGLHVEDA